MKCDARDAGKKLSRSRKFSIGPCHSLFSLKTYPVTKDSGLNGMPPMVTLGSEALEMLRTWKAHANKLEDVMKAMKKKQQDDEE